MFEAGMSTAMDLTNRPPVSDREFGTFLNKVGELSRPRDFR